MKYYRPDLLSNAEQVELEGLKRLIFSETPFVVLDVDSPEHRRFDELNRKAFHYPTIHLQGIGNVKAMAAEDIRPGQIVVFNYGYRYLIEYATHKGQSVNFKARNRDGQVFEFRKRKTTLLGISCCW